MPLEQSAKEYLNSVRLADRRIKIKIEELHQLQLNVDQIIPQTTGERVQSSNKGSFTKTVDKIVDLQNKINSEIDSLLELKSDVRNKINQLSDERFIVVLTDYYINCKTWAEVSKSIGYEERYTRKLHGWALQKFRKKFNMI